MTVSGEIGSTPAEQRREYSETHIEGNTVTIYVGDSREGWVESYKTLLELSSDERFSQAVDVIVDLSDVRKSGETLVGFGGVANPVKLPGLYQRCASILNKAVGRKLNSVECCLLIDEAAVTIVAGNIRRCLPEDALVHTEAGLVPIAKVRVGDRVLTSQGFYPVTNFFIQGEQSLCRIQTQDGSFECTADHKVAVLTDVYGNYKMVKAQDLQPGDRLVFVPQAIPGTATELPEFRGQISGKTKPITIPALTTDTAYFIGYLQGDGSVSSDGFRVRFRVHENSAKILSRLIAVGQQFGLETYTLRTPEQCRTKAYELQFNSSALNQYLKSFKQPFQPLSIPDCILLGTADIRKAYLAGLADADGCHSQGVLVASVHQRFLQQVQALYASLGITVRTCASIRKRTGKWEGELVTVGGAAFKAVENFLCEYSIQFSTQKRKTPKSFKDHGFPKAMVRPVINTSQYHWGSIHEQMTLPTLKKYIPQATDLVPVKVLGVELNVRSAPTYDIEVANVHEFVCEGILVSNSAGMRQFQGDDQLGATAKDNLWQQDENGNWRIDPERDALRMANHSRVFHHKPTLEECVEAVRKQYYSGEGAIQWAGEAVARANCDLLNTRELKIDFLQAYQQGKGKEWIEERYPNIDAPELKHRLGRYGLNPCHAGDTLVSTNQGLVPIKDLVGKSFQALVDLRSVGLDGVKLTDAIAFPTGVQTTYVITLANGQQMRCTADHQHFTNHGWVTTKDLTSEHHIYIQKGAGYFGEGTITVEQAQMLGWLYGDGSIYKGSKGLDAVFYINTNEYETAFPLLNSAVESLTGYSHKPSLVKGVYTFHSGSFLMDSFLKKLGVQSKDCLPDQFFSQSREVIIGFLQGLFSADGCVNVKGRNIELRNRSRQLLSQIQIVLLNLGIKSSLLIKQKPGSIGVPYTLKDGTKKVSQNRGSWRLIIYSGNEARKFWEFIGFPLTPDKQGRLATLATKQSSRKYSEAIISHRFSSKVQSIEEFGEEPVYDLHVPLTHSFIANGCITHNCGEIIGSNFHCNLSEIHLNQLDPHNYKEQEEAFTAGALSVAALLNHKFLEPRYQYSRELDPIVGVSFTGLFDFFVHAFGVDWLRWWEQGRPATPQGLAFKQEEQKYLTFWKDTVHRVVWDYCDRHQLKRPNRCTTVQPSGTKSLLTGASPGWHPPKAQRFIRRITFGKNDPVALACIDYGYNVIPSQSDKDEQGNLLNDPFDPRVSEWLVEIPVAVSWADLPGADEIDVAKFSVLAQLDFVMQVQGYYVAHNTSATLELRSEEVEPLGERIYQSIQNDEGYISAALLARFDDLQSFPRLPFEPIDKATYQRLSQEVIARRNTDDFCAALSRYDSGELTEAGPSGCDSDKCMFPDQGPTS